MSDKKETEIVMIGTGASNMRALAGDDVGPAKITDNVTTLPDITGPYGRAWFCDLAVGRRLKSIRDENDATLAHWVIEAPFAHPVWHSYSIVVVHLRPMPNMRPAVFYLDDATHEMWVFAINPDMDRGPMISTGLVQGNWLHPKNFAAQFIEVTDQLALDRIRLAVQSICNGNLSPDTDYQKAWEVLFGDNMIKKEWR